MTIAELYEKYLRFPSIQTDTRKIKPGDIFFALKGPNFNGNNFASQAIEQGAAYAVVDEQEFADEEQLIWFPDTLKCLQELALHHRQQLNIPFIAITGSNGKTTTKELIHAVLSSHYITYTTKGNLNNHIGVPLTILSVKPDAQLAVIEMGANHQKEIAGYCVYTLPTHGVITNCGKAHLEGFGGVEGVRKGKGELYDHLRVNDGTAFVMWDYDYLRAMSKGIKKIITYGTADADFVGSVSASEPFLEVSIATGLHTKTISTQLVGAYNLPNVLVALTIGKYFEVPEEKITHAIETYEPSNSRSQMVVKDGNRIILDAYNANPSSMKLAIENIAALHEQTKVLCLGAMAELGDESLAEHQSIVDLIGQYEWAEVALVGGDFLKLKHPYHSFTNSSEAAEWFRKRRFNDACILIKGSRSTGMEKILD
jgi:UDP-N-acetylmuramoyl-tripeptide--D-alanyl-D-alanine ligase